MRLGRLAVKKLWFLFVILALACVGSAAAQEITGTWQGTLHAPGRDLRTVLKITKAADGGLSTVFYSIDQGGQPLPATKTSLDGQTFRMSIVGAGLSYEGKLSPDGKTLTGATTQGASTVPLTFTKVTEADAWALPEQPKHLPPMPAGAKPGFDVATVKPTKPGGQNKGFTVRGGEVLTFNTSISDLLTFAFGLQPKQIQNGPAWVTEDHFDIAGKPDLEGTPSVAQMKGMIAKLLAERFGLKFHREKRELPVYALTVAKTGNKMTRSTADPEALPGLGFQDLGILHVTNGSTHDFAELMQSVVLDRPVVDGTGLSGRWDFTLRWTPDDSQFVGLNINAPRPSADAPNAPPPLFTALPEQLGLRLDATRAPVEVLVIDAVNKPSAN